MTGAGVEAGGDGDGEGYKRGLRKGLCVYRSLSLHGGYLSPCSVLP